MTLPVFGAGERVYAEDLNDVADAVIDEPLWVLSGTSATSSVTTEAVILTAPNATYEANSVYQIRFAGLIRSSTGTGTTVFSVRDTNVSGSVRFASGSLPIAVVLTNYEVSWWTTVGNTSSSDITRVLAITQVGSGCTALVNAGATRPYIVECKKLGSTSKFTGYVAL